MLERFVVEQNVAKFADCLCNECDPERQDILRELLLQEINRFSVRSYHIELVQRHIDECQRRIEGQTLLIFDMISAGRDTTEANSALGNMRKTLELFQALQTGFIKDLDRGKL